MYTLLSFRQFYDATFQAHRHTARGESVMFVDTVASFAGIALVFYLLERLRGNWAPLPGLLDRLAAVLHIQAPVGPETAGALIASAYLGGKMVSLVYSAAQFYLHRYPVGAPSLAIYRDYRSFGVQMALIGGITVLYGNIDRFLLGVWWDSKANVEPFQVTYQILTPMLFVAVAVSNLLFPSFSSYHAQGDTPKMARDTGVAERYMSMLIVPQIVLAVVFAREGLNIFSERFVDSAHLVQIFAVFVYFTTVASPSRSILLGTGQTRRILRLVLVNLVLILALNIVFVHPRFLGLAETGAALVISLVSLVTYGMTKYYTRKTIGGDWTPDGAYRHVLAGLLLGLVLWAARDALGAAYFQRFWQLGIVGALGALLYLGLLVAMREFRRADWDFFRDLIHPRRLAGYVGDELTPKSKP
jgi:O-antigen/teichoic acid export membrane protein